MRTSTPEQQKEYQTNRRNERETRKAAAAKRQGLTQSQIDYQKNKRLEKDARTDKANEGFRSFQKRVLTPKSKAVATNDYGIPAGRAKDGATAKGKDGVNRRYDAASKSWKIVR
jgi:hypothetical protein